MSEFAQAARDYYTEVDRIAAENVKNGMAPREAYANAEHTVKLSRSRKTITSLREINNAIEAARKGIQK